MNPAVRLKPLIIAAFGVSLAFVLALLFTVEGDSFKKLQNLSERVASFDKQRLQQEFAEKSLDVIAPLARQAEESGLDIEDQVKAAARDSAIKALFVSGRLSAAPSKANAKARPETVQQALDRIAAGKQGRWISAVITDKDGWVVAWWPADKKPAKELKADPFFVSMKSGAILTETPVRAWEKAPSQGALGKDGKPVPGSKGGFDSLMAVACGIEDASQNFAGLIRVAARAEGLFGLDPSRSFKSVRELSPKSSVILQRGNGDQVLNSAKGPYTENSSGIPDLKDLMAAMQAKASGWVALKSYDGKPALAAWRRVGSWSESQGGANLFSLLAVFPDDDVKAAGAAGQADKPRHFYARPLVLLLLLLAIALPLGLLLVLLPSRLDPLRRMLQVAGQIDEFGAVPEGLEFREEQDGAFAKVNLSLNALLKRAAANEHRAHELDAALRRVEDQASRDATIAAQELSELRSRVGGADSEKAAANAKFEAAQKARAEAEAQLGNLKSALETAQRSIDLKNSENKNLSAQIQDLMRSLEEQRKVAQQVQENTMRRDDELVRLSAVNTLSSELKATLTVIKNYISTMLGSVGAISDAQQEFLGVVINKSARLERLIADLVELSEIGSGIKPPRLETISAGSMVQEALLNTRPQADHKKIALEFAESGNVPQVSVDKERIGAIIRALLSQAVKVTSRGERVSILVGARENNVELRFSDPGMSLPPDRAAKVFNQFHGVDSQAGPEFIGTGLRFPIMRAIVEAHGGKVWIESQVGRGKTFVISIPKAGSFAPAAPRPAGAAAPSMPMMPPDAAPPAGTMPALPASKPTQGEVAKFDSIFGEMPVGAPPKPAFNPPPPPAAAPLAPPTPPAGLAGLPSLPSLPPLPGLPPLAPPPPAPALKPLGPPPAPGAVPAPPAPVSFKTEAAKSPLKDEDKSNFDAIFGGLPPQVADAPKPGGLPKVELKTGAALADADKSNFDAIFGGGAPKPVGPPPAPGAVPAPPRPAVPADLSNFDAIFGGGAAPAPPKPVGPPPAPGAVPAPPPQAVKPAMPPAGTLPADLSNFDAIFGSGPPPAPPKKEGGLNTMDDLKNMLGG